MNEMQTFLQFAVAVAREAGDIMRQYYNSPEKGIQTKYDSSPVTIADTKINQLLTRDFTMNSTNCWSILLMK